MNPKSNKRYDAYTRVPAFEKIQHDTQIGVSDRKSFTDWILPFSEINKFSNRFPICTKLLFVRSVMGALLTESKLFLGAVTL